MQIGPRLRELRETKNLSQGDIEKRTGLLRCYTSRVENGHTVPSVETLGKYARALEIPLHQIFHKGDGPEKKPILHALQGDGGLWGSRGKQHRELRLFAKALSGMSDRKRKLLFTMAQQMAGRSGIHKV
jgi:transcriptional regulator with XRE-family HTH domain